MKPLAERMRPQSLEEFIGQNHIIGEGKILRKLIMSKNIMNMIFYGPPGTGKTTLANVIAGHTSKRFYKLNATVSSVSDIKEIISDTKGLLNAAGTLLYIDEIQNFNKKQQQVLLEFIETGEISLIASTTENPHHCVYKAILSRSSVFEFHPLGKAEIKTGLERAVGLLEQNDFEGYSIVYEDAALDVISDFCDGDMRKALNLLEIAVYSLEAGADMRMELGKEAVIECLSKKMVYSDSSGDYHYDLISAFQKSIRGSDANAALHYLAKLINAGDLQSISRRLLVIAAEDIGLAYPNAISIVKACTDSAAQLGFPEARIPLAQAVILLATLPKSNSVITAIDAALHEIDTKNTGQVPMHLRCNHYSGAESLGRGIGYKYPHDYEHGYVKQQYMPDEIAGSVYYIPGENKFEKGIREHQRRIRGENHE
ncbi:AAA domain-containing protein YrvN [Peptoclostridium acidaminophilum DSM 3953]|uniref:AAA domain-containing protein YrvN n=1 Tax=Peptoclostridium acidaminophilum DSM 3953 TaxID=1286171 RepID=W8U6I9_PEPAC|nr:replication-associated recombination protein A [Peptoclostridium acidaminophilum]AHM56541.1 AAA domain-containing protein YrvN [Peptoclostridium acidaminophilum DSM 3953]